MSCLMCRYYRPIEPVEHREQRETGACERHCGKNWSQITAIRYVKDHRKYLDGDCLLHPQSTKHRCNDVCGQIVLVDYVTGPAWGIEQPDKDNLFEWAASQMQTLLDGTWRETRAKQLEDDNKRLRKQLKTARERSASRLERLRKTPEPEPVVQDERPQLRVVGV
jgi:hypothetical protein